VAPVDNGEQHPPRQPYRFEKGTNQEIAVDNDSHRIGR
jgi:hypothetical protein